jgi:aarF domain-containing kinase
MASRYIKSGLKLTGVALGGAAGFAAYKINTDEGANRSWQFWKQVFPIFAHYRYYQLLNRDLGIMSDAEADKHFNELHDKYSNRIRDITYTMRGFYLKQAQLLSTQDDFIPPAYMTWVKDTQDNVPSEFKEGEAKEFCRSMLKKELNLDFDQVFSEWDEKPLGVASIGQVHKAKLRSSGNTVAVKLLIPGMEPKFRCDIRTMKAFCQLAMPQHVSAFNEIEKQFCTEFDYVEEAKNLKEIYDLIMPKWKDLVEIPFPYMEYCSKHVLVMDCLDGVKLVDGIRKKFEKLSELTGKTLEDIENEKKEAIKNGTYQFKSVEESKKEQDNIKRLLFYNDLMNKRNIYAMVNNFSLLRLINGTMDYDWSEPPVDLGHCIEVLCKVHANQIFEFGEKNDFIFVCFSSFLIFSIF